MDLSRESYEMLPPTSRCSVRSSTYICQSPAWTSEKKIRLASMWSWNREDSTCKWQAISNFRLASSLVRTRELTQIQWRGSLPNLSAIIRPSSCQESSARSRSSKWEKSERRISDSLSLSVVSSLAQVMWSPACKSLSPLAIAADSKSISSSTLKSSTQSCSAHRKSARLTESTVSWSSRPNHPDLFPIRTSRFRSPVIKFPSVTSPEC